MKEFTPCWFIYSQTMDDIGTAQHHLRHLHKEKEEEHSSLPECYAMSPGK